MLLIIMGSLDIVKSMCENITMLSIDYNILF